MIKAVNRKFLFNVSNKYGWDNSHCHKPTPLIIDSETIRVYFGTRDDKNRTRTTFVDLDASDVYNLKVTYEHDKPVLNLGKIGTFDDSGVNVCSILKKDIYIYMYYIGWNPSTTVHTRNSIGLVFSEDQGKTFYRCWDGPILDRNRIEPYYTGAVDVFLDEDDKWHMWYTSGTEWKIIHNKPEVYYHIKYAYSEDGIDWKRPNISCIPSTDMYEATARPSFFRLGSRYAMIYSRRSLVDFRCDASQAYRAGFALSRDKMKWERLDSKIDFDISDAGWDSNSIAYPYVLSFKDKLLCFYNGNGFGKTGFGYCILELIQNESLL